MQVDGRGVLEDRFGVRAGLEEFLAGRGSERRLSQRLQRQDASRGRGSAHVSVIFEVVDLLRQWCDGRVGSGVRLDELGQACWVGTFQLWSSRCNHGCVSSPDP